MTRHIPAAVALSKRVAEILGFVRFTNKFRRVERLIWYKGRAEHQPELNGEHTYQLCMVAWFIQQRYLPHLDLEKVLRYCLVHDKPEIYAGDTPAFAAKGTRFEAHLSRATKKRREKKAIKRIKREWGSKFPDMLADLEAYERREDEEGRFVDALDKFLAELNIYEDRGRTDRLLQITRSEKVAYKRKRIKAHPFLLDLYDDFCTFCDHRTDIFFQPEQTAAE